MLHEIKENALAAHPGAHQRGGQVEVVGEGGEDVPGVRDGGVEGSDRVEDEVEDRAGEPEGWENALEVHY